MENRNQTVKAGHITRTPLLIALGIAFVLMGLGFYVSLKRTSAPPAQPPQNQQQSSALESAGGFVDYLEGMSSPVMALSRTALESQGSDAFNIEDLQTYVSRYESNDTPAPVQAPAAPAAAPAPAALTPEQEMAARLRQMRDDSIMRSLRAPVDMSPLARGTGAAGAGAASQGAGAAGASLAADYAAGAYGAAGTLPPASQAYLNSAALRMNTASEAQSSYNSLAAGGAMGGMGGMGGSGSGYGASGAYGAYGAHSAPAMNSRTLSAYNALGNSDSLLNTAVEPVLSPYLVRQGAVLPCVLMTGINSDLPGMVQAQVTEDVYDSPRGDHVLIPRGSKVTGQYASAPMMGQERLMLAFNRVIFPDGRAMNLGAMPAAGHDGWSGLSADVDTHFWSMLGHAVLLGGITAGISLSTDDNTRDSNGELTLNGALSQSMGQSLGRVMTQVIERNMNLSPTLKVQPGFAFNVTLTKDIYFDAPYHNTTDRSTARSAAARQWR